MKFGDKEFMKRLRNMQPSDKRNVRPNYPTGDTTMTRYSKKDIYSYVQHINNMRQSQGMTNAVDLDIYSPGDGTRYKLVYRDPKTGGVMDAGVSATGAGNMMECLRSYAAGLDAKRSDDHVSKTLS